MQENITSSLFEDRIKLEQQDKEKQIREKDEFFKILEKEGFIAESIQEIDFAYDISRAAHSLQRRDSGEHYFDHLRSVGLILVDECKITDPEIVITALHHDAIEDTAIFGSRSIPFSEWKRTAKFRIEKTSSPAVAQMVIDLTKPKADGEEIKDEIEAYDVYINGLKNSRDPRTILIKMADRLHNLRTLAGTTPEKQRRVVLETREIYFPIFKMALDHFPKENRYMLSQMEIELNKFDIE